MSAKLPEFVPFNDPVTVCAACKKVCCLVQWHLSCDLQKRAAAGRVAIPLAEVQALAMEHPSYWKGDLDRDGDVPVDLEALGELTRHARANGHNRAVHLAYLISGLGIDPEQVEAVVAKEWPEAGS